MTGGAEERGVQQPAPAELPARDGWFARNLDVNLTQMRKRSAGTGCPSSSNRRRKVKPRDRTVQPGPAHAAGARTTEKRTGTGSSRRL